jgi:hypothetical protein
MLDAQARAIGVMSFKLQGTEGLNFVVPINYARGLLSSTESYGLAELLKRLEAAPKDVFASTTSKFPARWKSLVSGVPSRLSG